MMRNNRSRRMKMPSNPQTAAQSVQRGNFGSLSANWDLLTETQRDGWRGLTRTIVNRVGLNQTLSGKDLYVALNRNLFNSNNALIDDAPVGHAPTPPASITLQSSLAGIHLRVSWTVSPVPANTTYLVFATAPQTTGTSRPNPSKYKLVTIFPTTTASPQTITTPYEAIFGTVIVGKRIFVKIIAIDNPSGYASAAVIANIETAA